MNERAKRDTKIAAIIGFLFLIAFIVAGTTLGWDSPTQAQDHERAIKESSLR